MFTRVCRSCVVVRRSWSEPLWSRSVTRRFSVSASSSWLSGSRTCLSENFHFSFSIWTRTNPTSRNAKEPSRNTNSRWRTERRSACHRVSANTLFYISNKYHSVWFTSCFPSWEPEKCIGITIFEGTFGSYTEMNTHTHQRSCDVMMLKCAWLCVL